MDKRLKKPSNSKEFDAFFEDNDITELVETKPVRINVDLPAPMLAKLDAKANQIGLTRQSIIKYWIAQHLKMTA